MRQEHEAFRPICNPTRLAGITRHPNLTCASLQHSGIQLTGGQSR